MSGIHLHKTLRCVSFTSCTMYTVNICVIMMKIFEDLNIYLYTKFTSLKFLDFWEIKLTLIILASLLFLWDLLMCGNAQSENSKWFIQLHINWWEIVCLIKICILVMFFVVFHELYITFDPLERGYIFNVYRIVCLTNATIHILFALVILILLVTSNEFPDMESLHRPTNNQAQVWLVPTEWDGWRRTGKNGT